MPPTFRNLAFGGLMTLALAGGLAVAAPYGPHRGGPLGRMAERLDLSDDQRAQISDITQKSWQSGLGDAVSKARTARRTARQAIHDPAATEQAIRDASRDAAHAEEDLAVLRHQTFTQVYAVLTPEQQAKAKDLSDRWTGRGDRFFERIDSRMREDYEAR